MIRNSYGESIPSYDFKQALYRRQQTALPGRRPRMVKPNTAYAELDREDRNRTSGTSRPLENHSGPRL